MADFPTFASDAKLEEASSVNKAAFLSSAGASLKVDTAPLNQPGPREILIRNHAVAINPIDYKQQDTGISVRTFPHIMGMDVAGTVVEVSTDITNFKKGDRIAAVAPHLPTGNPAHASFQLYTVVPAFLASKIPDDIAFTDAAALPLGLTTAAWGLFENDYLEIPRPSISGSPLPENKEKVVLIWGGSSSVGASAIQLLAASGYTILATSSSKNFDFVKDLGATQVFDYTDKDVVKGLIEAARGKQVLGAYDAIGADDTARSSVEWLHALGGGKYMSALYGTDPELPDGVTRGSKAPAPLQGVDGGPPIWNVIWQDFMGEGLKNGKLRSKPEALVLKGGLARVNEGIELVRKGTSAKKIVVQIVE
ncbi:oxidoreductase [Byssothecium circinans]|uniref:Oxidoreductase n=1 Tax=Byssothecium circinans TaxID=147558 RepID=A0A6A5TNZ9_9PLEO|nr:oxidoreductase [Byssothecium circinans]